MTINQQILAEIAKKLDEQAALIRSLLRDARMANQTYVPATSLPEDLPARKYSDCNEQEQALWREMFERYRLNEKVRNDLTWEEFACMTERSLPYYENILSGMVSVPIDHKPWDELCRFYSQVKGCSVAVAQTLSREKLLSNLVPKE